MGDAEGKSINGRVAVGQLCRRGQCFFEAVIVAWHATIFCCGTHACISPSILFKTEGGDCGNSLPRRVYKLHISHTVLIEYLAFKCKDYVLADVERPSDKDEGSKTWYRQTNH